MKRLTTELFIKRASVVHNNKFDYSMVDYKNQSTKVKIICPEHGIFLQRAGGHITGKGCAKCSGKGMDTSLFRERANKVHKHKYNYSNTIYSSAKQKVAITCPIHGDFEVSPDNHIGKKVGCTKCSKRFMDTAYFIEQATKIHGKVYDYSSVEYINNDTKITIICRIHGAFEQSVTKHFDGCGCPDCAVTGYVRQKPGELYIHKSLDGLLMKIGISNHPQRRFTQLVRITPFKFNKIESLWFENGMIPPLLEGYAFEHADNAGLSGFSGCTEWFKYSSTVIKAIKAKGQELGGLSNDHLLHLTTRRASVKNSEDFIRDAEAVHGNKYKYLNVEYINSKTKICIICPEHGEFFQCRNKHISSKQGCPKCADQIRGKKRATNFVTFVKKAKLIYGDKYQYNEKKYTKLGDFTEIVCPLHGAFRIKAKNHVNYRRTACRKCKNEARRQSSSE